VNAKREKAPARRLGRRARIAAVVGIGLVVVIYVGVLLVANAQLGRLLPRAIAEAVGGQDADRYTVEVGDVRLAPSLRGVTVEDLTVAFDSAAATDITEPALVRAASLGSVRVSGVRLIPLLRGEGIFVSSVEIDEPRIELDFSVAAVEKLPASDAARGDAASPESEEFSPPEAILRRIRIRDGSVDLTQVTERGTLTSFLHGLDLELTEIRIDTLSFANPGRALTNSRVSVAFDTVRHVFGDSLYVLTATQVRADSRDSLVRIGTVQLVPTLEAAPFFDRLPERADRINMSAGPIRVEGLDFAGYVSEETVHVRLVDVDSLDLHVYSDINLDWGPRAMPCRYHNGFAEIPFPLRIDTIRVNDALIRYSELANGSERPGELTLEELNGTVVNLTNDPDRMTYDTPAVANVTAKLFGEAPMQASLAYPLLSPTVDFSLEAAAGPMDLVTANRFATNTTGVEVEKGQLDSLWLSAEVKDGQAEGRVLMLYRDLDFRLVNKNSGKEMAWHAVAGFAANIVLRSNNPGKPEDTPRDGKIEYSCGDNDMVFFEFFVHFLANGLKRIVI